MSSPDLSTANVRAQLREYILTHYSNLGYDPAGVRFRIEHADGQPLAHVVITLDVRAPNDDEIEEECPPDDLMFDEHVYPDHAP